MENSLPGNNLYIIPGNLQIEQIVIMIRIIEKKVLIILLMITCLVWDAIILIGSADVIVTPRNSIC